MTRQGLLKTFFLSGLSLFTGKIHASQELIEVYSCNTCNYEKAKTIAKEHLAQPDCQWEPSSNERLNLSQPILKCDTSSKNLIIANPLDKRAFKFNVKATNNSSTPQEKEIISTIESLSLTTSEKDLLKAFYNIDRGFRTAVSKSSYIISSKIQSPLELKSTSSNNEDSCASHPISYFGNQQYQANLHEDLTKLIEKELFDANWFDNFKVSDVTESVLKLSKGDFGFQISLQHNEIGSYISKVYGSSDNLLNFEVKYNGEFNIGGTRKLNLTYKLNRGASTIDGIRMNLLFSPVVDLTDVAISNCLSDFIEENSKVIETIDSHTRSNKHLARSCSRKIKKELCSTEHNGQKCTNSIISLRC
ncbi:MULTISPECIES: hypothetical protein [unclassified Pseudoalteromonas]|uniref:hypothetical protein n=1 Tax=unclassified Pseudoalteromonas TaxID=194690 RepID=UPI001F36DAD3|nr:MULTISPECIES: hypothetical protein [unclassified Pseudoalteromonas]MCF2899998.1 hypothetical protein [Pseudoalteromonas sp. OFAV1]MCO7249758.1 hypothetical protein [Pseudoalteromonas sp. Ps84H-4]